MSDQDYYAVSIELLLRSSGLQDARRTVERYFEQMTLDMQDHGFEYWEPRTVRGVTATHINSIELPPSPPFRGKFKDQAPLPMTDQQVEDAVDRLFRSGHDLDEK